MGHRSCEGKIKLGLKRKFYPGFTHGEKATLSSKFLTVDSHSQHRFRGVEGIGCKHDDRQSSR